MARISSGKIIGAAAVLGARVDVPMVEIPTLTDTEPRLRIPQPPGWTAVQEDAHDSAEDPDRITHFAMDAAAPSGGDIPAVYLLVTSEMIPAFKPQQIFDGYLAEVDAHFAEGGAEREWTTTYSSVCGLPALVAHSPAGPRVRPLTVLVVATEACGDTYRIAVMAIPTTDDPVRQRDVETIMRGFQVLPPESELLN